MLAYLDALIAALSVRDAADAERLLAHPLARILSEEARAEAVAFVHGDCDPLAAPLRVMQLRHRTAELLTEGIPVADRAESAVDRARPRDALSAPPQLGRRAARQQQMELPLSA